MLPTVPPDFGAAEATDEQAPRFLPASYSRRRLRGGTDVAVRAAAAAPRSPRCSAEAAGQNFRHKSMGRPPGFVRWESLPGTSRNVVPGGERENSLTVEDHEAWNIMKPSASRRTRLCVRRAQRSAGTVRAPR